MYPSDWPRCPVCGDFAMDGHLTCGRAECSEGRVRREREDEYAARRRWLAGGNDDEGSPGDSDFSG